jgi:hypothetical protein
MIRAMAVSRDAENLLRDEIARSTSSSTDRVASGRRSAERERRPRQAAGGYCWMLPLAASRHVQPHRFSRLHPIEFDAILNSPSSPWSDAESQRSPPREPSVHRPAGRISPVP